MKILQINKEVRNWHRRARKGNNGDKKSREGIENNGENIANKQRGKELA